MVQELYPRTPNRHQLERLDEINLLTLEEFERRWVVSRQQLSHICHCSLATVNHWYACGHSHREPGIQHRIWLALADKIWRNNENQSTTRLFFDKHR